MVGWYGTRDQVLFLSKAFISVSINWRHLGSLEACVKYMGSTGVVAKSAMRQVSMGYWVANQIFGVLVLSCVLVIIWWVLVEGGLGEPEDEDDEKDSSAGAGGGGGGVCDGGDSGGVEESMVGPAWEEGTGTMEGNRDEEIGIDGEGVRVGGERG